MSGECLVLKTHQHSCWLLWVILQSDRMQRDLTVLLSAEALLAFGAGDEVRVADGLVDIKLLLFA